MVRRAGSYPERFDGTAAPKSLLTYLANKVRRTGQTIRATLTLIRATRWLRPPIPVNLRLFRACAAIDALFGARPADLSPVALSFISLASVASAEASCWR
jgi:hypothetical protein